MPSAHLCLVSRLLKAFLTSFLTAVLISACGGGSGGSDTPEPAGVSFRVQWDREGASQSMYEPSDITDCLDVATVSAAVYDVDGSLLQTGGPWNCTDGQGIVSQVPSNHTVQVAVVGYTSGGLARYRGESGQAFYLPAGGSVDAGLITAGTFQSALTSPADGATVMIYVTGLTLRWSAVSGADSYIVEISDDVGFAAANILQTLTVDASADPFCQPDTSTMQVDYYYYWRVHVIDGAGNQSEPSGYRQFLISYNTAPVASIAMPSDGAVLTVADLVSAGGLVCAGSGTDLEDKTLTGASLVWWAVRSADGAVLDQIDGVPITGELVTLDYLFFSAGSYRITLQATDSDGATDTVYQNITVTN